MLYGKQKIFMQQYLKKGGVVMEINTQEKIKRAILKIVDTEIEFEKYFRKT